MTHAVTLPYADFDSGHEDQLDVYLRFIGHFRSVPVSRIETKILTSIQFTADLMECSDAHIAKVLVEIGLRAPRDAFPIDFLNYFDRSMKRTGWAVGAPSEAMLDLSDSWSVMHANTNYEIPISYLPESKTITH